MPLTARVTRIIIPESKHARTLACTTPAVGTLGVKLTQRASALRSDFLVEVHTYLSTQIYIPVPKLCPSVLPRAGFGLGGKPCVRAHRCSLFLVGSSTQYNMYSFPGPIESNGIALNRIAFFERVLLILSPGGSVSPGGAVPRSRGVIERTQFFFFFFPAVWFDGNVRWAATGCGPLVVRAHIPGTRRPWIDSHLPCPSRPRCFSRVRCPPLPRPPTNGKNDSAAVPDFKGFIVPVEVGPAEGVSSGGAMTAADDPSSQFLTRGFALKKRVSLEGVTVQVEEPVSLFCWSAAVVMVSCMYEEVQ